MTSRENESADEKHTLYDDQQEMQSSEDPLTINAHSIGGVAPGYLQDALSNLHPTKVWKSKGSGLGLPLYDLKACSILILGCGDGRDVYIASQLVGQNGRVVGFDTSIEELDEADEYQDYHAEKFGFNNTEFICGNLESLNEIESLKKESFDVIAGSYVVNDCADKVKVLNDCYGLLKPGGEMYLVDVFTNRRVPTELMHDQAIAAEHQCSAVYWNDFINEAKSAGFDDPRLVEDAPEVLQGYKLGEAVSRDEDSGLKVYSATYRLFKIDELEPSCEDYGQAVIYKGTIPYHEKSWSLEKSCCFEKGRVQTVCGNTWYMLEKNPKLRPHFDFIGDFSTHYGIYERTLVARPGKVLLYHNQSQATVDDLQGTAPMSTSAPLSARSDTPPSSGPMREAPDVAPTQSQRLDHVPDMIDNLRMARDAASTASLLYALRVLARDENKRWKIFESGGIQCVVDAMRQYPSNVSIQEEGCATFTNMACIDDAIIVSIAAAEGIQCILDAMTQHLNHASIQRNGCKALGNLSCEKGNRVSIAAAGGIRRIHEAMRQHLSDGDLQGAGCRALQNLACNIVNQASIAAAGGILCVLDAMRQHSTHVDVQGTGCWALRNLAATKNNAGIIALVGGIECILDAMRQHPFYAIIQRQGCGALRNLSMNGKNRPLLRASGAVQVVQSAQRNFPEDLIVKGTLRKLKRWPW